jgi:hypothetical protein
MAPSNDGSIHLAPQQPNEINYVYESKVNSLQKLPYQVQILYSEGAQQKQYGGSLPRKPKRKRGPLIAASAADRFPSLDRDSAHNVSERNLRLPDIRPKENKRAEKINDTSSIKSYEMNNLDNKREKLRAKLEMLY